MLIHLVTLTDEIVQQLEVAVPDGKHHWRPVVRREHAIDELWVCLKELNDLLGLIFLDPAEQLVDVAGLLYFVRLQLKVHFTIRKMNETVQFERGCRQLMNKVGEWESK